MPNQHKHKMTAWNTAIPGLAEWIRAEAERRGESVREFLDHVLSEYRARRAPDSPDREEDA